MISDNTSYMVGMWFIGTGDMDWMAQLYKDKGDERWKFSFRFRYYEDETAFDSHDRKSFYTGTFPSYLSEEDATAAAVGAADIIAKLLDNVIVDESLIVKGDLNKFQEVLEANPRNWVHLKFIKVGQS